MRNKQAVVETDLGTIVIDLLPEAAPNHVGYFIKNAQDGTYAGTTFHRVVRQGIVQGGDPLTKDPSKVDAYGTGGFGVLRAERNAEKNTRGAVSAVVGGGNPDSGGTQFFICVADQPGLDGMYDVFGRVSEGILVAQKISEIAADEKGRPTERIAIRSVTIRDKPAAGPEAFSTESAAELGAYRAVLETSMGDITLEFTPDKAPEHVRNFLRLAQAGVYNGMGVHRVAKGFVIQTGYLPSRSEPLSESQQRLVRNLQPEFNDTTAREGHRLDGSRRQSRQRRHIVLHRPRSEPGSRREVHGLRPRRRRLAGRRGHRAGAGERRGARRRASKSRACA